MKRYFKGEAEVDLGKGTCWLEYEGQRATRQVEVYNGRWFCSLDEFHPELGMGLTIVPLQELEPELGPESGIDEISAAEFEAAWNEAVKYRSRQH